MKCRVCKPKVPLFLFCFKLNHFLQEHNHLGQQKLISPKNGAFSCNKPDHFPDKADSCWGTCSPPGGLQRQPHSTRPFLKLLRGGNWNCNLKARGASVITDFTRTERNLGPRCCTIRFQEGQPFTPFVDFQSSSR